MKAARFESICYGQYLSLELKTEFEFFCLY
jgi:hypothetical protein